MADERSRNDEVNERKPDKIELVNFINNRFRSAKQWKFLYADDAHKGWVDNIKFYKGFQWAKWRRTDTKKSSIVINKIFSAIQQEVPFMTDSTPKLYVQPTEPSDQKIAKILEQILETQWVLRNMDSKLPKCVINAKQVGTGFFMPFWNPNHAQGLGDVDCGVIDPINVFPFSGTEEIDDTDGVIHAEHVSVGFIRRMWPETSKRMMGVKTDPDIPDRAEATNESARAEIRQITDTTGARTDYVVDSGSSLSEDQFKKTLLLRVWFRDDAMEEYEEERDIQDDNGNLVFDEEGKKQKETVTLERKQFPNGRLVTMSGGVILADEPYEWQFPLLIPLINYLNPNEFWGMGDVDQIKDMQKELNKLHATVIDIFREMGHPTVILAVGSGIPVDNFVKSANAVYESNVPNPAQVLDPASPSAAIFGFIEQLTATIEKVAGFSELSAPKGGDLPSGRSLQEFQEITQTRLRQKIRNMENAVRHIGQAWLEMILKNYTGERVMRIVNSTRQGDQFVFVFNEQDPNLAQQIKQQAAMQIIPGTEQVDPMTQALIPGSGQPMYSEIVNLAEIKGEFDVTVATNSTVSTSKIAFFDQAKELFGAGVIDQEALLDAADYPNRDEIMKRMSQAAQQAAQAQAQQEEMAAQTAAQGATPIAQPPEPPKSPKINLSLKGEDLMNPVAAQAVMAGLMGGGNGNGLS